MRWHTTRVRFPFLTAAALGRAFLCALLVGAASCGGSAQTGAAAPAAASSSAPRASRRGVLVTYKAGKELWREEYEDDGDTLTSQLSLGGPTGVVRTSRTQRKVTVEQGSHRVERDIPAGTVALENGDWQAYAIAAEWYADAQSPRPLRVLVPGQGAVVDGTITVAPGADGGREVKLTIGELVAEVTIDRDGKVVAARVPAQRLEVRPVAPGTAINSQPAPGAAAVPPHVDRRELAIDHEGGKLTGELSLPKGTTGPVPLAVIVPGSGPTDHNGNSELGLRTDAYKQIAAALAERGIATLRYDKRGVGGSQGYREDGITLTSSSRDLTALVKAARAQGAFSSITLVGHSEGGLVALHALGDLPANALVLVATPGRTLGAVLRDQLIKGGVPAGEVDRALLEARKGKGVSSTRPDMQAMFRPSVLPFLRSILEIDPTSLLRGTKVPTTIVQGDNDRQISREDAELLHGARPDARLVVVRHMTHVLKEDPSDAQPQRSYVDPTVAVAAAAVDAIAEAARR